MLERLRVHASTAEARAASRVCVGCGRIPYPDHADGIWACATCTEVLAHGMAHAVASSVVAWLYGGDEGEQESDAETVDYDDGACIDDE